MWNTLKGQLEKDTKIQSILFQNPMWKMTSYWNLTSENSKTNKNLYCSHSSTESTKIYSNECKLGIQKHNLTESSNIPNDLLDECGNNILTLKKLTNFNKNILISRWIYTNRSMGINLFINYLFYISKRLYF